MTIIALVQVVLVEQLAHLFTQTATRMTMDKVEHKSSHAWMWVLAIVLIVAGWIFFSQAKDKSDYNDALRVTGARVECRAEAKREGWSEAESGCSNLGTPGHEVSTDNYFNAYKLRTGAREL